MVISQPSFCLQGSSSFFLSVYFQSDVWDVGINAAPSAILVPAGSVFQPSFNWSGACHSNSNQYLSQKLDRKQLSVTATS